MRKLVLLVAVLGALTLAQVADAAVPQKFQFQFKGLSADALWSDFPESGVPTPGTVYTNTFVAAAQQATKADGTQYNDKYAFVERYQYTFDADGNYVTVGSAFGEAGGSAVSLSIDRRLTSASLSAQVALTTCGPDACSPAGVASLGASWTGQGSLTRSRGSYHYSTKGLNSVQTFSGTYRAATAALDFAGLTPGEPRYAALWSGSSRSLTICHTPAACY